MKKLLLAALVATSASAEYKSDFNTTESTSIIELHFLTEKEIDEEWANEFSGNVYAFTTPLTHKCVIRMPTIEGWNDKGNLHVLGHEVAHCFGAVHKEDDSDFKRNLEADPDIDPDDLIEELPDEQ
jgi:hypothetical protein